MGLGLHAHWVIHQMEVLMKRLWSVILALPLILVVYPAAAAEKYSFEVFLGTQFNARTPLTIDQKGEEKIEVDCAEYDPDAFTGLDSPYYAWRIGLWDNDRAWELELIHQKIILENKPDEVQHFEISHGYNLITINRAWEYRYFIFRVGAGIVLTHPQTTVRNKSKGHHEEFPDGFYISGPTAQVALGKRFPLWRGLFGVLETKLTASYATGVPIADGDAEVPNAAFHALFGLGYEF